MAQVFPFQAVMPTPSRAAAVATPPYDVMSTAEARQLAAGNPLSFLRITRSELELPDDANPYADAVYALARSNYERLCREVPLTRDTDPAFYIYSLVMNGRRQTGVTAAVAIDDYDAGIVKKHEKTRRDKEDDRTRHIDEMDANDEPVFLTYHADPAIDRHVAIIQARPPVYDFVTSDGIGHTLWVISDPGEVEIIRASFAPVPALYVADGHHRSAAATRVCHRRREANPAHTGHEAYNHFLAVVFPHDQMKIMPYNRVVKDLHGLDAQAFLARVRESFACIPTDRPEPERSASYGMFLGGTWYRLRAKEAIIPAEDPVRSLDIAVLQDNLLNPVLGIEDPRRDKRIDFVGGIRGTAELERRVQHDGWAVAFAFYPVTMEQLMRVADAGQVMPPKSTWFEPKLRSGLFVRPLGD